MKYLYLKILGEKVEKETSDNLSEFTKKFTERNIGLDKLSHKQCIKMYLNYNGFYRIFTNNAHYMVIDLNYKG
jgi:hypothetical protein